MPSVVLARALTYSYNGRMFRRGEPQSVPEPDYHFLMSQGFIDPGHELQVAHPSRLPWAPAGTEVPVIRTGGLGDVLMVLPALRELAARFPKLRFTYATSEAYVPLMRDCSFLHRCVPLSALTGRYQWAIDLRGYSEREGRERFDRLGVFARYLLADGTPDWTYPIAARPEERTYGMALTGALEHQRPTVGIVIGSHSQSGMRNWPITYVERMAELVHDHGMRAVIIDDKVCDITPRLAAAGARSLAGHLTVPMLVSVLASLDYLVSPDTGALHLAEALGIKTVGYFTTIPPEARAVHYRNVRTLYAGVSCAPCYHAPSCGLLPGTTTCALEVKPERVWREIEWMSIHAPPYDYRSPLDEPVSAPVRFNHMEVATR
jgi:ADP-heptose:LPS heptosyltransferase